MNVLLFLIILVSLIVVHELGHFAAAKWFGIRVDEFGLGFPPKLFGRKFGETLYSINLIPFGGFVKIFGEDGQTSAEAGVDTSRSFIHKHRLIQAAVLVAGVFMNVVAAWLILSSAFLIGLPKDADSATAGSLRDVKATVVEIAPNSPAGEVGMLPGDHVLSIQTSAGASIEGDAGADALRAFIAEHSTETLSLTLEKGGEARVVSATPSKDVVGSEGKAVLGVSLVDVGILELPIHKALIAGAVLTYDVTIATAQGLGEFFTTLFRGKADFSSVSGPVGIVGVVGQASDIGLVAVLTLAAVISINLAIINLIPFPALDGGRLLIVGIEAARRKAISPNLSLWLNAGGFIFLIGLMLIVTYHDIAKLFI